MQGTVVASDASANSHKLLARVAVVQGSDEGARNIRRTANKKENIVSDAGSHDAPRCSAVQGHDPSLLPKFYTIPDVADVLKVSIKTVRRWIDDGEIAVYRFSRQIRISESDLSDFIRRRRGT